jgi:hypothetical protein
MILVRRAHQQRLGPSSGIPASDRKRRAFSWRASRLIVTRFLVLTLTTATGARGEPNELAALQPGEPTAAIPAYAMVREVDCLAMNVYWEARSEPDVGQQAVAFVTLNRVAHPAFPDSICEVVKQTIDNGRARCQFSWLCDGREDTPREDRAWQHARLIAHLAFTGRVGDPTRGALWYHSEHTRPAWTRRLYESGQIGRHVFYRETVEPTPVSEADSPRLALLASVEENDLTRRIGGGPVIHRQSVTSAPYLSQPAEDGLEPSRVAVPLGSIGDYARTDTREAPSSPRSYGAITGASFVVRFSTRSSLSLCSGLAPFWPHHLYRRSERRTAFELHEVPRRPGFGSLYPSKGPRSNLLPKPTWGEYQALLPTWQPWRAATPERAAARGWWALCRPGIGRPPLLGHVPGGGVGAVGRWPAAATANESGEGARLGDEAVIVELR